MPCDVVFVKDLVFILVALLSKQRGNNEYNGQVYNRIASFTEFVLDNLDVLPLLPESDSDFLKNVNFNLNTLACTDSYLCKLYT